MPTLIRVTYYRKKVSGIYSIKRRAVDRYYTALLKLERANTCEKCQTVHPPKSKGLHVSHYFSRARETTRFDRRNTDLLCLACHYFFSHHRAEYTKWKRKRLGQEEYLKLFNLAKEPFIRTDIKRLDAERIKQFKSLLKPVDKVD